MRVTPRTYYIVLLLLSLLASACHHKDIDAPYGLERELDFVFDCEQCGEALPEGMTLCFYPLEAGSLRWTFNLPGAQGGKLLIPTGVYAVVAYSNDSRYIDFNDRAGEPRASIWEMSDGGRRVADRMYSAALPRLEVTPCGVRYTDGSGTWKECGLSRVRMAPRLRTVNYTVLVEDVANVGRVRGVSASLSGLDGAFNLLSSLPADGASTVNFTMEATDGDTLHGFLRSFGTTPGAGNTLTLLIRLTDGTFVRFSRDVSRQIENNSDPRNVLIVIKGLDIPDSGGSGSPIDGNVDVDGWTVVNIDITTDL